MTDGPEPRIPRAAWWALGALWVAYAALKSTLWGLTYWDFGDGNYLYIARRINEGLTLYRDILAPQPPLHTLSGMAALRAGEALPGNELLGVRVFSLLVRIAQSLFVFLVAWRAFRHAWTALVAAQTYLFMPIGFWWGLCYQSENLEIVFLMAAVWLLLEWTPRRAALAGAASALAMHCNMTGVPFFLVNVVFLLCRRPRLAIPYAGAALGVWGAGAGLAQALTAGYYLDNVVLNQVGTFPRTDILQLSNPGATFWTYVMEKVPREFRNVMDLELGLLIAAAAGLALHVGDRSAAWGKAAGEADRGEWHRREFLAWSAIGGVLSICFTAKGGTVNYIFVLGEPLLAVFAALAFTRLVDWAWPAGLWRTLGFGNTQAFLRALFPAAALALAWAPAVRNISFTFREIQSELPEAEVLALRDAIATYAKPGDTILAPPFYAYITGTRVAGELAENYIWQIKYMNERFDREEGLAVRKMEEVAHLLERREVAFVVLDMDQTGRVPEVAAAIAAHYREIEPQALRTRNTTLRLYIPAHEEIRHRRLLAER
ncbi:MAG: hypothetical protein SF028_11540 [Candidatus Sumerlaeia bacterium]|nr:hypothetical protein [Candidatus Sumerlaeia bacterium]